MGELLRSDDYKSFRGSVQRRKLIVDDAGDKSWTVYDAGPRSIRCPLIFLPPASGRAEVFFKQILELSASGYRVIAVDYPIYWKTLDFCEGFRKLLDHMHLDKVHLFGASLGGFLAQKFAVYTNLNRQVASLILCNTFVDTTVFDQTASATTFWMMPALMLKKMVMGGFDRGLVAPEIADAMDFVVDSLDSLSQQELAARLTLNCSDAYVEAHKINQLPVTLIDVYDESALAQSVREETYKCYPNARRGHLKSGGNFPYLSRSDEVNLYVKIHLRDFHHTAVDARDSDVSPDTSKSNTEQAVEPSETTVQTSVIC